MKVYKQRGFGSTESVFIEMSQEEARRWLEDNTCYSEEDCELCQICDSNTITQGLLKVLK